MTAPLPAALRAVLPHSTAAAWPIVVSYLPDGAYLVGGTAVAVHLAHRVSRDLDVFTSAPFDARALNERLTAEQDFVATTVANGTLNGLLGQTKVQFLDASSQSRIAPLTVVAGMPVAALEDLVAMKIKVIGDRGELRDYFDLMVIEEQAGLVVEEGLGDYLARFNPREPLSNLTHLVLALVSFDDVLDDPGLPVPRATIEDYWRSRVPSIAASLSTYAD